MLASDVYKNAKVISDSKCSFYDTCLEPMLPGIHTANLHENSMFVKIPCISTYITRSILLTGIVAS